MRRYVKRQPAEVVPALRHALFLFSALACYGVLIIVASSPTAAQQSRLKSIEEMATELRDKEKANGCVGAVQSAGYANVELLGVVDRVVINVRCDDGSSVGGRVPRDREAPILNVALAAFNSGKPVHIFVDDNREIILFGVFAPATR